jgi:hypothetical protein
MEKQEFLIGRLLGPGTYRLRVIYPHWPIDRRVDARCDDKAELAVVVEEMVGDEREPRVVGHVDVSRKDAVTVARFAFRLLRQLTAPGKAVMAFLDWVESKNKWT